MTNDLDTFESNSFERNKPDRLSFNVYWNMEELKATSESKSKIKSHRRSKSYGGTMDMKVQNLKTSESNGVAEMTSNSKLIRVLIIHFEVKVTHFILRRAKWWWKNAIITLGNGKLNRFFAKLREIWRFIFLFVLVWTFGRFIW